jgi:hypothetical protein
VPLGGTTIDNTSADFTTFGLWASATTPTGFEGSDYVARASGDANGSETIQDNSDAGFSVTGTWVSANGVSGYYGTDYVRHDANQPPPEAVIVDNGTAGASIVGTWSTSTNDPKYGANFRFKAAGTGTATHTWTPTLPTSSRTAAAGTCWAPRRLARSACTTRCRTRRSQCSPTRRTWRCTRCRSCYLDRVRKFLDKQRRKKT